MLDFFSQPVFQRLAVTLLHALWQGAIVAVVLGAILRGLNRSSAQLRYVFCGAAMTLMVAAPLVTFTLVPSPGSQTLTGKTPPGSLPIGHMEITTNSDSTTATRPVGSGSDNLDPTRPVASVPAAANPEDVKWYEAIITTAAPYVVLAWMLGVLLFGLRLLCGFLGVRSLIRSRIAAPSEIHRVIQQLSRAMRMAATPLVACSTRIGEAMVVGFFRPVVLLPVAWITQLSPEVLRSVIAHELAHVRRWDQWVNLLQRVVEVVLFYHPAVWWVSHRMRTEREFRCDEMAAQAVGGPVSYAEALEHVGRLRAEFPSLILATSIGGTKMALLKRVRNVLGVSRSPQKRGGWSAGVLAVCLPLALCATAVWWQSAQADDTTVVQKDENNQVEREREQRERRELEEQRRGAERREGERRRESERREEGERRGPRGERPDGPPRGRDGDRPRGERPAGPPRGRDGDRPRPDGPPRRPGAGGELRELMEIIRDLRAEVARLRRDVNELQGRKGGPHPPHGRDGDRPRGPHPVDPNTPRRELDRPRPPRGEESRPRPPRGEGDRDKPRGEGDRRPAEKSDRPRPPRSEGDRPRGREEAQTQTGRLMFGVGVNSDAGVVRSIVLNEYDFNIRRPEGEHPQGNPPVQY